MARFDFVEADIPCTCHSGEHSWEAWCPVDPIHDTWYRYSRRCVQMGCLALQRVEDLGIKGRCTNGYTEE